MIVQSKIQQRLAETIRQSGMTQKKKKQKLRVSQQMISQYLLGKKMPALDTFANLCEVLDADPAYILCLKA